jgi:hypothetical protein
MPYFHVIAKATSEDKFSCLFSDLSSENLAKKFVKPYEKGEKFFSGNDIYSPADLRSIKIIKTERTDQVERDELNRKHREEIDEINRSSQHPVFISLGGGYEPEDIADAGEDVTHSLIKGPPGFKAGKFGAPSKAAGWIGGIIAAVAAAGIAKWLGWV